MPTYSKNTNQIQRGVIHTYLYARTPSKESITAISAESTISTITHIAQNIAKTCQKYFQSFLQMKYCRNIFVKYCKIVLEIL